MSEHTAWNEGYDAAIREAGLTDYGLTPNPYPAPRLSSILGDPVPALNCPERIQDDRHASIRCWLPAGHEGNHR